MENKEILQWISIFLQYPKKELLQIPLHEEILHIKNREVYQALSAFLDFLQNNPYAQLEEIYVQTFDFNEKTNLYLTYSKLKEERERGPVLVKLKGIYEEEGFEMNTTELPDYLPLFLEFLSIAKLETIKGLLPQFIKTIQGLNEELKLINSPYHHLAEAALLVLNEMLTQ